MGEISEFAAPAERVQHGVGLDPQQWRGEQVERAQSLEPQRRGDRRDRHTRVDDELQRPGRPSATAATQFGTGVPSSKRFHSSGRSSIGYSSPRTISRSVGAIARWPRSVTAGSRPERIQRRTVSGVRPTRSAASATVNTQRTVETAADPPATKTRTNSGRLGFHPANATDRRAAARTGRTAA
jgi:hypothetical protein